MKKLLIKAIFCVPIITLSQTTFTNSNAKLVNPNLTSGCAIGIADMNGDKLDDIIRLDDARFLQIEYQDPNGGNFTRLNFGDLNGSGNEWGLCIADVDKNGYNDIFTGGSYNGLKLLLANSTGTNFTSTVLSQTQNNGSNEIFLQNANFADIDSNGTIDIFACHDEGISSIYSNNGSGTMTKTTSLINPAANNASTTSHHKDSGNYGTIWVDYDNDGDQDLYIAKCRLGVSNIYSGSRVNLLFQNDGNGNFTEVGVAAGLVPYAQSWSSSFEDLDNDGDLDCVLINHDVSSIIYENNGNGTFTNITASTGIDNALDNLGSGGIQVVLEDFDNDTFVDIFITSRHTSNKHVMFKNNGNKTFSVMPTPFNVGNLSIQSAAVGDLNNDGFLDVVAGFATNYNSPSSNADILFFNNGNLNNWSQITLEGNDSNINGIGARVEIHGSWGTQIREVRSGESYGTCNSLTTHFGIGSHTSITKIVVKWPSGTIDQLNNPNINESINIVEGSFTLNTATLNKNNFNLFPNPTRNKLSVEGLQNLDNVSYEIFDITGKIIQNKTQMHNSENTIDMTNFNSGIYFVHLLNGNTKSIHKVIRD